MSNKKKSLWCRLRLHAWEPLDIIHNKRTLFRVRFCNRCAAFEVQRNGGGGDYKWYTFDKVFDCKFGDAAFEQFQEALDEFIERHKNTPYYHSY